jgi:hypothetical protein
MSDTMTTEIYSRCHNIPHYARQVSLTASPEQSARQGRHMHQSFGKVSTPINLLGKTPNLHDDLEYLLCKPDMP